MKTTYYIVSKGFTSKRQLVYLVLCALHLPGLLMQLKLRLHWRFLARDFLKSSTKCGGYTRNNVFDSSKNIQLTEIITITVDDFEKSRGKNHHCSRGFARRNFIHSG